MHPDFNRHTSQKRAILNVLRQRLNVLRNFISNTYEVLRHTLILQSVARKALSTQWHGGGRNSATLLSLRYLYIYICTYMHVCIGVSKERRSNCCPPALSVSA